MCLNFLQHSPKESTVHLGLLLKTRAQEAGRPLRARITGTEQNVRLVRFRRVTSPQALNSACHNTRDCFKMFYKLRDTCDQARVSTLACLIAPMDDQRTVSQRFSNISVKQCACLALGSRFVLLLLFFENCCSLAPRMSARQQIMKRLMGYKNKPKHVLCVCCGGGSLPSPRYLDTTSFPGIINQQRSTLHPGKVCDQERAPFKQTSHAGARSAGEGERGERGERGEGGAFRFEQFCFQ